MAKANNNNDDNMNSLLQDLIDPNINADGLNENISKLVDMVVRKEFGPERYGNMIAARLHDIHITNIMTTLVEAEGFAGNRLIAYATSVVENNRGHNNDRARKLNCAIWKAIQDYLTKGPPTDEDDGGDGGDGDNGGVKKKARTTTKKRNKDQENAGGGGSGEEEGSGGGQGKGGSGTGRGEGQGEGGVTVTSS
jgi:hypothetical protein